MYIPGVLRKKHQVPFEGRKCCVNSVVLPTASTPWSESKKALISPSDLSIWVSHNVVTAQFDSDEDLGHFQSDLGHFQSCTKPLLLSSLMYNLFFNWSDLQLIMKVKPLYIDLYICILTVCIWSFFIISRESNSVMCDVIQREMSGCSSRQTLLCEMDTCELVHVYGFCCVFTAVCCLLTNEPSFWDKHVDTRWTLCASSSNTDKESVWQTTQLDVMLLCPCSLYAQTHKEITKYMPLVFLCLFSRFLFVFVFSTVFDYCYSFFIVSLFFLTFAPLVWLWWLLISHTCYFPIFILFFPCSLFDAALFPVHALLLETQTNLIWADLSLSCGLRLAAEEVEVVPGCSWASLVVPHARCSCPS